jgi:hypothetical protein
LPYSLVYSFNGVPNPISGRVDFFGTFVNSVPFKFEPMIPTGLTYSIIHGELSEVYLRNFVAFRKHKGLALYACVPICVDDCSPEAASRGLRTCALVPDALRLRPQAGVIKTRTSDASSIPAMRPQVHTAQNLGQQRGGKEASLASSTAKGSKKHP